MERRAIPLSLLKVFVLSRLLAYSSAGEIIQSNSALFTAFKCGNDIICAASQPDMTFNAETAVKCVFKCQLLRQRSAACVGVNYRQQIKQCDIFFTGPTSFTNSNTGCQYIQVRAVSLMMETTNEI